MVEKILLARPRGFCAGVERAIGIVEHALEKYGRPVYVRHEIVHNEHVIDSLKGKGAVFVDDLADIPEGSVVILSAHGSTPDVIERANNSGHKIVIDAVCPLVRKVHKEAENYSRQGYSVIIIGKQGHQEVVGTLGYAPGARRVLKPEDVGGLEFDSEKVAFVTQTTLSVDDTADVVKVLKKKYPGIESPAKEDICFATQNRQNAVKELGKEVELILVLGSKTSSNSRSLEKIAKKYCEAYLVLDKDGVQENWLQGKKAVGITSSASSPEVLVKELVDYLKQRFLNASFEEKTYSEEMMRFPVPDF